MAAGVTQTLWESAPATTVKHHAHLGKPQPATEPAFDISSEPQFESLDIEATSAQLEVTNWLHHILSPHEGRPQRLECLPELLNPCCPDLRLAVQQ
jgi:hypothetical protein